MTAPEVILVAHTMVAKTIPGYIESPLVVDGPNVAEDHEMDDLAEQAGRLCYLSWDRPNPKTATNQGYLANIIDHGHFSVLEHASVTFYFGGVSRSLTHELVRHRHLSFSQVSQRYVDESDAAFVVPPDIANDPGFDERLMNTLAQYMGRSVTFYNQMVTLMGMHGFTRKEARQAARAVLPSGTATKILVTGNLRAWRDVVAKRISKHADAEMQRLFKIVLKKLIEVAPNSFQDMKHLLGDDSG